MNDNIHTTNSQFSVSGDLHVLPSTRCLELYLRSEKAARNQDSSVHLRARPLPDCRLPALACRNGSSFVRRRPSSVTCKTLTYGASHPVPHARPVQHLPGPALLHKRPIFQDSSLLLSNSWR